MPSTHGKKSKEMKEELVSSDVPSKSLTVEEAIAFHKNKNPNVQMNSEFESKVEALRIIAKEAIIIIPQVHLEATGKPNTLKESIASLKSKINLL